MSRARRLAAALALTLAGASATLAASGAAPAPAAPARADAGTHAARAAKITYTKQTVLVSSAVARQQHLKVSKDGATFTFAHRAGVLKKLKKGSVLLVERRAVRTVESAKVQKGHLVVVTSAAAITDVIKDGTISLDSKVDWSKAFAVSGAAVPTARMAARRAGQSFTIKGKADTWDYSVTFSPSASGLSVKVSIGKSSPVEVDASVTGTLTDLKSTGSIAIKNSTMTHAQFVANNVKGSFKLGYTAKPISAYGLGQAGGVKVTLPAEIAVPFFVGPIPFYVGVKVAFFASAGFSSFDQELSGDYTIDYDGKGGFSATSSGATTADGVVKGLGKIILDAAHAVNSGPLAFTFGAQTPELSLGMGTSGLNIAGNVTLVAQSGIATQGSGCDTRKLEIMGSTGITGSFFGLKGSFYNQNLFDKSYYKSYPTGCGTFPS